MTVIISVYFYAVKMTVKYREITVRDYRENTVKYGDDGKKYFHRLSP